MHISALALLGSPHTKEQCSSALPTLPPPHAPYISYSHNALPIHPLFAHVFVALAQRVVRDDVGCAVAAVDAPHAPTETPEPAAAAHEPLAQAQARLILPYIEPEVTMRRAVAHVDSVKVLDKVAQLHPECAVVDHSVVQLFDHVWIAAK